jgi:hypothetical protein
LADFDNDGRLDLVVMNRRAPMELYRNITENTGNWISVTLSQPGGNRNAIGAEITIETDNQKQYQQLTVGGGHAGGKALPLHFGVGDATTVRITITWPDGTQTAQTAVTNSALVINR